jgi:hypothetical protein
MSETTAPPPGPPAGRETPYDDTLALNDIHAVLTSPSLTDAVDDALHAIAEILARTGRSPYPSRIITATVEDGPLGIPVACIDSEGTIVTVCQDPNGPGIRIDITPRDPADEAAVVIAVGDKVVHRANPAGLHLVPHRNGGQS